MHGRRRSIPRGTGRSCTWGPASGSTRPPEPTDAASTSGWRPRPTTSTVGRTTPASRPQRAPLALSLDESHVLRLVALPPHPVPEPDPAVRRPGHRPAPRTAPTSSSTTHHPVRQPGDPPPDERRQHRGANQDIGFEHCEIDGGSRPGSSAATARTSTGSDPDARAAPSVTNRLGHATSGVQISRTRSALGVTSTTARSSTAHDSCRSATAWSSTTTGCTT